MAIESTMIALGTPAPAFELPDPSGGLVGLADLDSDGESRARLASHAQQVVDHPAFQEHRDLSRVDGSGGYAVPPAWLMNQYVELARPGRAFANLVQRQPLPGGTDSINIPKLLTGTATAVQTADNQPVQDTDLTDTFINAPVRTISGQQGVAVQLLDQSPIAFDDLVFRDLIADYASQLDKQCLSGSGTNGQVLGMRLTPNIGTIAVSTVDIQGVYSAIANAIQLVHTTRFQPPEVVVMHPRRWGWFVALLDNQQRPLVSARRQPAVERRGDPGGGRQPAGSRQYPRAPSGDRPQYRDQPGHGRR